MRRAIAFLGLAGAACAAMLWHQFGSATGGAPAAGVRGEPSPAPEPAAGGAAAAPDAGAAAAVGGEEGHEPVRKRMDLLALVGSYEPGGEVRHVFVKAPAVAAAPAPGGESTPATDTWLGDDPPKLKIGVLLVGDRFQRAAIGGAIVGIGDAVAGCKVTAIRRDAVLLRSAEGRTLTYDFEGEWPREFRRIAARRHEQGGSAKEPDAHAAGAADPAAKGPDTGSDNKKQEKSR